MEFLGLPSFLWSVARLLDGWANWLLVQTHKWLALGCNGQGVESSLGHEGSTDLGAWEFLARANIRCPTSSATATVL